MMMHPEHLTVLLALAAMLGHVTQAEVVCPWSDPDLERWSDPATWHPDDGVPGENATVVIPAGKKILLDAPIKRLLTLTVDGVLVWDHVSGIKIETSYILVNGEFHIGSEECSFTETADIFLYGMSDAEETVEGFGRKFIGATSGSKLEIHGKPKKSWTKLVSTVVPVKPGSCGYVYDSRQGSSGTKQGLHITVWNLDGTLRSFNMYITASKWADRMAIKVKKLIDGLPDNKIVAIAVHRRIGVNTDGIFEGMYTAMEGLGASRVRDVQEYEPYVLIALTGDSSSAVEGYTRRLDGVDGVIEASASLDMGELVFKASSDSFNDAWNDEARFRVVRRDAAFPKLSFLHDVSSWEIGDEVVVASTDFDWRQAEVRTIAECSDCAANQIRVNGDFKYTHFGEVTYGVDERGEVGLLSRNIRVEGELQDDCYSYTEKEADLCDKFHRDTFGAHTKVLRGAQAHIEGVQLTHMGQQSVLATYPLHFHMCDAVPGMYLRNNAIRDSNSRCITIHGTDFLNLSDNVCLNHLGHGIFLEDSCEQNNTIHRNLIIGTQYGTLLPTDKKRNWCEDEDLCQLLSSFWITHPNNYFTENAAAGSDGFGMTLSFSDKPLGLCLERSKERGLYQDKSTRYMKVPEFSKNVMHSNTEGGLWFENRISSGETEKGVYYPVNAKMPTNDYMARDPPNENGALVDTVLKQLTMYKNEARNAYVRCGNVIVEDSSFADGVVSYQGAHSEGDTSCDVRTSIFIGETDNKGEPLTYVSKDEQFQDLPRAERPTHHFDQSIGEEKPHYMIMGVSFYQGPVYIDNCYFDQFKNWWYNDSMTNELGYRPLRPASALSFKHTNHYPSTPVSGVRNLKFGYCDGTDNSFRMMNINSTTPHVRMDDGIENSNLRDYDGSLTGVAGVQIVKNRPYYTEPDCFVKQDWGLALCSGSYFQLVVRGDTGVLQYQYRGHTPVIINKDSQPQDPYVQSGERGHKYVVRAYQSYTIRFNATLGNAPRDILIRPRYGLQKGETIRLALCLPKSTTQFKIRGNIPVIDGGNNPAVMVDSLAEVDADTTMRAFYWDKDSGYLYFKLSSPYSMEAPATTPDMKCPENQCQDLSIKREDGDDNPAICTGAVTPYYNPDDPVPDPVVVPDCVEGQTGSPEGLGAPIETGFASPPPSGGTCV